MTSLHQTLPGFITVYVRFLINIYTILVLINDRLQGSYAGARSAHMKVLYPDVVFGAIASSGVTFATIDNWRYYDIIRQFADQECIKQVETTVSELDVLLSSNKTRPLIQGFFGVPNITHVEDVGNLISVSFISFISPIR